MKPLVAGLMLVLCACGSPSSDLPVDGSSDSGATTDTSTIDPRQNFNVSILDRLDRELAAVVQDKKVANVSYVLIKDGQRVASGFHGTRTLDGAEPIDDRTLYRIYSMTKPITAVAILTLYEDGKLSLDDPITKFLPEFETLTVFDGEAGDTVKTRPAQRAPTIRELLLHTAGFAYNDGKQDYVSQMYLERQLQNSNSADELVQKLSEIPLMYEPGQSWSYSIASDLQGAIIERISGGTLEAYLKERIFDPLGMTDTSFHVTDDKAARLAVSTGWTKDGGMQALDGSIQTMWESEIPLDWGGHGLVSTISDYERFASMLLNEGSLDGVTILKPESVAEITSNGLSFTNPKNGSPTHRPSKGSGFGYGVAVVEDTIVSGLGAPEGTYYWDGAAGTWFWVDPRHDLIFIGMLQNTSSSPIMLRKEAMKRVYNALITDYFPGAD